MEEVVKKRFSIKIVIAMIVALLVLCGILGVFLLNKSDKEKDSLSKNEVSENVENKDNNDEKRYSDNLIADEYFDKTNPIPLKANGRYGYISSEGEKIVDFIYDSAWGFFGNYGVISDGYVKKIIDRKGNIIYSGENHNIDYSNAKYGNYVIDKALYDLNLKKVSEDNLEITSVVEGGYFTFYSNKKYGIINSSREVIYESDKPLELEVNIGYNNVYGIVKESDYVRGVHNYYVIDMLTGNKVYRASDNEIIEKKAICLFIIKNTNNKYDKVIVIKNGKIAAEIKDSDIKDVYWRDANFSELTISYSGNIYKSYNIEEKKLSNDIYKSYPSSISKMESIALSEEYKLLRNNMTTGIENLNKEKIIPDDKFVNLMSSTVDSYNYILNKYNKIFVVASNSDSASFYELKSKNVIFSEESVGGIYMPYDTLFACTKKSALLTWSENLLDVSTIFNLFTGEKIKLDEPEDVKFGPTYYAIEKDGRLFYYNSNFDKIYEVDKS